MSGLAFKAAAPVERKVNIVQGEHFVTDDEGVTLTTVLGSCVAACLFDPLRGVGGMNHFLLAESGSGGEAAMRYGAYAMEVLINDLMQRGAARDRLQAKVFGGAKMVSGLSDIGAGNVSFVRRFLSSEGIPITSESLGGFGARRVEFNPTTGRVRVREADPDQLRQTERARPTPIADGGIELF